MVMPWATLSTSSRNSAARGSGVSLPMICRHSCTGRPVLMPRTMMSEASANSATNFFARLPARKPTIQRGRPMPATKARARAISGFWPRNRAISSTPRPSPPEAIQKVLVVIFSPACCSRAVRLNDALRWLRS